ncbi:MAG: cysteine--tRNA ligase [Bauldia sp.]|nr:cysteine--tRNA ligase [Bauldia sp.]
MGLKLYNTLTRSKDEKGFVPIDPANVRMYVCGPTVYDFAHIGNARPLIVFDVLFRLLRHLYGPEHVTYVRNITDVDDKINARAAAEYPDLPLNEAIREVTTRTEKQFHEDVAALGCLTAEQVNKPGEPPRFVEPRATEHIAEMRAMIEALIAKGCAYVAEDHVLFHVAAMTDYGRLSNRSLDDMIAGARVEVAPYKRDPMDFVLWKPSKPGEPAWASPAGINAAGRPGWHLECSAMSDRWLWQEIESRLSPEGRAHPHEFDIHGGGIDLVFPHHENEIAQSRCAHGTPVMARYWLHNGFLQVEGEKMSKSLGNFVTIRELLRSWKGQAWSGPVVRLAMLRTHYRQPLDWTYDRLYEAEADVRGLAKAASWEEVGSTREYDEYWREPITLAAGVEHHLQDDLNTAAAVNLLLQGDNEVAQTEGPRALIHSIRLLGLFTKDQVRRLAGRPQLTNVPGEMSREVSQLGKDYLVASANNDVQLLTSLQQRMNAVRLRIDDQFGSGVRLSFEGAAATSIESLVAARAAARKRKDFAEADRIRAELDGMGIALKDAKDPKTGELVTTWEVKR